MALKKTTKEKIGFYPSLERTVTPEHLMIELLKEISDILKEVLQTSKEILKNQENENIRNN